MRHLCDFACFLAKQVLSQLSYTPIVGYSNHFPSLMPRPQPLVLRKSWSNLEQVEQIQCQPFPVLRAASRVRSGGGVVLLAGLCSRGNRGIEWPNHRSGRPCGGWSKGSYSAASQLDVNLSWRRKLTQFPFRRPIGRSYGQQRNQEMRPSGLFVSGHFGEVLQPAVRGDGGNPGCGLQVFSLSLQGQDGIRSRRVVVEAAVCLGEF